MNPKLLFVLPALGACRNRSVSALPRPRRGIPADIGLHRAVAHPPGKPDRLSGGCRPLLRYCGIPYPGRRPALGRSDRDRIRKRAAAHARRRRTPVRIDGAQVNQLVLVNNSKRPLILLAGEIVTGGKQDRVIGKDRIIPAESDPIDLGVFCVEPGRWTGSSDRFGVGGSNARRDAGADGSPECPRQSHGRQGPAAGLVGGGENQDSHGGNRNRGVQPRQSTAPVPTRA